MQLVLLDENGQEVAHYGEFTPELADAFFADALSAMQFRKDFPQTVIQNEVHLRQLATTFSQMGLLQGDPDAIQQWMRPYIENELARQKERTGLMARAADKVSLYTGQWWSSFWSFLLSKGTKWLSNWFSRKNFFTLLLFFIPHNFLKP